MRRRGGISRTQNAAASHRQATSRHRLQPKVSLLRVSREVTLRKHVSHLAFLAFSNRPNIGLRLVYYTNTIRFNINLLCQTRTAFLFRPVIVVFAVRCICSLEIARLSEFSRRPRFTATQCPCLDPPQPDVKIRFPL